jgi:hypothetical protein
VYDDEKKEFKALQTFEKRKSNSFEKRQLECQHIAFILRKRTLLLCTIFKTDYRKESLVN